LAENKNYLTRTVYVYFFGPYDILRDSTNCLAITTHIQQKNCESLTKLLAITEYKYDLTIADPLLIRTECFATHDTYFINLFINSLYLNIPLSIDRYIFSDFEVRRPLKSHFHPLSNNPIICYKPVLRRPELQTSQAYSAFRVS